ncbi:MAG: hypothetical protein K0S33_407 [Bacteroidetes bacterium]|jgi:hypothetical protein|nr:hypothetical protein [Bacteroidota bacterium]
MVIETPSAFISLIEEQVLVVSVKDGMTIDLPEMWENYNATIQLNPAGDYPVIFETRGYVNITKEARELAATKEMAKESCAMAIMVDNMAMRIFANFYMKVNKPMRPTRSFTDKQKAIAWCKEEYSKYLERKKS